MTLVKPSPAKNAPERTVKMRRLSWREDTVFEVVLIKRDYDSAADDVWVDGRYLGTVEPYTGSLDRVVRRIRHPGKRRRLWKSHTVGIERPMYAHLSRAEAVRWLL